MLQEQSQPSQQSVQERFSESGNASDACHSSHSTIEDAAAANLIAMSKPSSLLHQTRAHFDEDWFGAKVRTFLDRSSFQQQSPHWYDSICL